MVTATDPHTRGDFGLFGTRREFFFGGKHTHLVCSTCLEVYHARLSLDVPGSCGHWKAFSIKSQDPGKPAKLASWIHSPISHLSGSSLHWPGERIMKSPSRPGLSVLSPSSRLVSGGASADEQGQTLLTCPSIYSASQSRPRQGYCNLFIQEQARLAILSDREWGWHTKYANSSKGHLCSALTSMQQRCDAKKKNIAPTLSPLQTLHDFTSRAVQIICSSCFPPATFQNSEEAATAWPALPTEEGARSRLTEKVPRQATSDQKKKKKDKKKPLPEGDARPRGS